MSSSTKIKNVLISGSTGLIGKPLTKRLREELNCRVISLTTSNAQASSDAVRWNPTAYKDGSPVFLSKFPIEDEAEIDAVIHLGGRPLDPLWTKKMKQEVYDSRVNGAKALVKWMNSLPSKTSNGQRKQRVLITASGVGGYLKPAEYAGPALTERDPVAMDNFLAKVGNDSEHACDPVRNRVRVAHGRFGVVLDPNGGALKQMLLPFKLGLGGPMGGGRQIFPWVSLRDVVDALIFTLNNEEIRGPFNVVSPSAQKATQGEFASALGKALGRPAIIPVPGFVLRTILGSEAADTMLLGTMKVAPELLLKAGYQFKDTDLQAYLTQILKQS